MAKKTANFMLGLFVILGFFLGVSAIIWVGATSFFQKGQTYITYFDESVQGLQSDSNVKYRGVDVGRVERIRVAPDNKLIGVVINCCHVSVSMKFNTALCAKWLAVKSSAKPPL
jgi:phospholipid/cholesterol/gamma-HCH transport system substrate-binding protein